MSTSSITTSDWLAELPPMPDVEFSQFGPIESVPLSRQQRLVGAFLARNWMRIPHVTHHDEVDIDALEQIQKTASDELGRKLTLIPFLIKAVVNALQQFPQFNASLSADGAALIMKRYFHIGV
ncbi:MAG TPA: 2-oxo acid dehydrogenase subunit E2, partial [Pseudomonadales bacterium]|nr:2-oxo acid dehydrogenase subunit E2 [Pseudomonadales bacterium]